MISMKNVSFSYSGEKNNINHINFEIKKGECILLCGRSGCGKTTIIRLLNGLIPNFYSGKLEGEVVVDKMIIKNTAMYEIAQKVGSVFQNPRSQFINTDSDSEIAFGIENMALPKKCLKERVNQSIKDLQVEDLRNRNVTELSGGEKQKIAFASIYAMNPNVYVLDEPSANLDYNSVLILKSILEKLKKQGKTIIISEHRLFYLMDIVDRIIYIDEGEIKNILTPQELLVMPTEERKKMGLRSIQYNQISKQRNKRMITNKDSFELRKIAPHYKEKINKNSISCKVESGDIIGIVGKNGAGKSTLSRAICGLHKKYEGDFWLNGKKIKSHQRLKKSYMVMQDVGYQLFAESVEEECCFGIKNPDHELALKTLTRLDLFEQRYKHPNLLSGGQKQRLAVAVSMICKRDILIFDEPTSGLDYDNMICVSELVKQLAGMGKIIFMVSHDQEFLSRSCNQILKL